MKAFIIISALIAVASAAYRPYSPSQNSPFGRQSVQVQQPSYQQQRSYSSAGGAGPEIPILRQNSDISPDGSYSYEYETGNGISASENGVGGVSAQGQAQWTAPDGTPVQFSYVADENGYQPTGSHLPTPPPIPEAILRALEYIRTHPSQDSEGQYRGDDAGQQQIQYNRQPSSPFRANRPYGRRP